MPQHVYWSHLYWSHLYWSHPSAACGEALYRRWMAATQVSAVGSGTNEIEHVHPAAQARLPESLTDSVIAALPPIKFPGALALSVIGGDRRAWGGLRVGGIATVATAIGADLAARLPRQNKKQREGLALLVATALDVRDVNLMELAAALPRAAERLDMRYQWISRLLGNALIDTDE